MVISGLRKTIPFFIAIIVIFTAFVSVGDSLDDVSADIVSSEKDKVISIAHRGYSDVAPENTLPAFQMAYDNGFEYVETDIAMTADGEFVLLHDSTIDRTSNGSGEISSMTLAQVKEYDFGSWKSSEFAGTKIPTLDEFLALCSELGLHPYIELKDNTDYTDAQINAIIDKVDHYGLLEMTSFISFSYDYLKSVRDYCDSVRLGYLTVMGASVSDITKVKDLRTGSNEVFIDCSLYSTGVCDLCRSEGVPLEVWTGNDIQEIQNLDHYISGVTSNSLKYWDYVAAVDLHLDGCIMDNQSVRTNIGEPYKAVVKAADGMILGDVECLMGGVEQTVYGGVISIGEVTGDIEITASASNEITFDSSDYLKGYSGNYSDQTVYRSDIGGRSYYAVSEDASATIYGMFDIVLSPNSVYQLSVSADQHIGDDYKIGLQFFDSDTKSKIDDAYLNSAVSIKNCTACCYDTSWIISSSITIRTGNADGCGDFMVTLQPSSAVVQEHNVIGFRMVFTDDSGTSYLDPEHFTVTLKKTACAVSFDTNGGSQVTALTVAIGGTVSEPVAPSKNGYSFAGWYSDSTLGTLYNFTVPIEHDICLYAKWTIVEYSVKYFTNGGSSLADGKYTIENDLTLPQTSVRDGYSFAGWYDNSELTGDKIEKISAGSTGDKCFYAKWTQSASGVDSVLIVAIIIAVILLIAIIGYLVVRSKKKQ